jgi:N-acetylmuramoyl-L-alanine amidase
LIIGAASFTAPAFAARTVVIDAGHGGHDRGGVPGQQLSEKIYTLDVARRLQERLAAAGFRTADDSLRRLFRELEQSV